MAAALPHSPSQHVVVSGRIIGTHSQPSSHAAASSKLARARNVNADGTRKNVMLEFRGIDRARFKYLRFRCKDKPATHDFYTTLGMTLDWTVEQEMRTVSCYQFKTSSPRFNENSLWLLFDWQKVRGAGVGGSSNGGLQRPEEGARGLGATAPTEAFRGRRVIPAEWNWTEKTAGGE
ncbi:hypothetical protein M427DRAFT_31873 [Gonapodya prolifera JEL478]|uniref:Uncharacterized protein n=1 Tax=Gonapodya prolifera (strain JEL478) TaxID=1344416 RepID=A0A139AGI5_GONPJ|nr:hypothetical protein M427DRAFT_31873 [Gonapodya prolifera JEL478]|eukprot:KXS15921.1 hypothetical protein M427DRAFT_31873 [Gonapodya prolifera JEL478]